jgi:hypothetical protein
MEKKQQPIVAGLGMRTSEMPPETPTLAQANAAAFEGKGAFETKMEQEPNVVGLGLRTSAMPPEHAHTPSPLETLPEVVSAKENWDRRFGQNWKE